ncbi:MAG: phage major capsid protein [Clostridiaceae bacterium]|nr:phage major capsid protein [Clostridiaceae bacterium]
MGRKGSNEENLRNLEIQANLSTLEDPSGGYLVPVEMDNSIERLALSSVAMRRIARVVTAKGDYQKPLSKGGGTGGWVAEKGDRDETETPELTLFSPPWCELYANPSITQKLLDTSDFDVAAWLIEEITDVFASTEGTAFISGDGVGKPRGITAYDMVADASWTYGKVGYIAGGHASLLNNVDKLIDLQHALKPVYRQRARWLMNDTTLNVVRKFKDGEGNFLWQPGLTEDAPDTLLGKPIEIDENMPDIGADAYPIAFGDFKRAYTIVDHKAGTRLLRDPYSKKGFVYFYTVKMVAAGISNFEAIKFLKISVA